MLNGAMVLMILAGIFGLPAVMCSGFCSALGSAAAADGYGESGFWDFMLLLALLASIGSIIVGAMVKRLQKKISVISALAFSFFFGILILQGNVLGLFSALMLLISAVMIYVAPPNQFRDVNPIQTV